MSNSEIVFLVPSKDAQGGVSTYYHTIKSRLKLNVRYVIRGNRNAPARKIFIFELYRFISDLIRFTFIIKNKNVKLVQISPSLLSKALIRDVLFLLISLIFRKKNVVFFHGWDLKYEEQFNKKYFKIFKRVFFKSDCIIVLAEIFKKKLIDWGYKGKIFIETAFVDDELLQGFDLRYLKEKNNEGIINLFFLSRVEKEKGVYEVVDSYSILKEKFPNVKLTIAGDGLELNSLKKYAISKNINDIDFTGFVQHENKAKLFRKSHLFIFPSYYPEGMPASVLEAMAFGLPVITTKIGGLADILEEGINGSFVHEKDPQNIADKIEVLIKDKNLFEEISLNNYNFISQKFVVSVVAKRFESILINILE